jgi:signal transduction histidine kinase
MLSAKNATSCPGLSTTPAVDHALIEAVVEILRSRTAVDFGAYRPQDTGIGLDPALMPQLFRPFSQGANAYTHTNGGLGLGLALVKALAELHGGSVMAHSGGAGKGSQFVVRLPLEGEPATLNA